MHTAAADGDYVRAAPHIALAVSYVHAVQESLKCINARVRAIAVLFTSETTRASLVGGEIATVRDLLAAIFMRWNSALESIVKARDEFN
jgi:hypothetical protein